MELANILLQAPGGSGMTQLIMFGAIGFIFYFFMIRPQTKRQKEERIFRESLGKGDKVHTIGGIHGKIVTMEETTVILQIDDTTKIRIEKSALRAAPAPVEPKQRITFTYPVLNNARTVFFLVSGENKAPALDCVVGAPTSVSVCPSRAVKPTDGTLVWWVDEAAANRFLSTTA